jgi:uncharacterized OB-fold protein
MTNQPIPGSALEQVRLHGEYWRIAQGGRVELVAQRCSKCDTHYLPRLMTCVRCGSQSFTPAVLSSRGSLYTYSIIHGSGGVWPETYAVGYVDFPEGVRVFGQIKESSPALLRVGMSVGIEPALLYRRKEGTEVTCYRFCVEGADA